MLLGTYNKILAHALLRLGLRKSAINILSAALSHNKHSHKLHYLLGSLYLQDGHNDAAIPHLSEALAASPHSFKYRLDLTTALLSSHKYSSSEQHLDKLLEEEPFNPRVVRNKALWQIGTNKLAEAIETLEQVTQEHPDYAPAMLSLAHCYFDTGEKEKAEQYYLSALSIVPDNVYALLGLANLYLDQHQFLESVKTYRKAHQIAPESAAAAAGLIRSLLYVKDSDSALTIALDAYDRHPDDPLIWLLTGDAYRAHDLLNKSEKLLRDFTKTYPQVLRGWVALVETQFQSRDFNDALHTLEEAIAQGHQDISIYELKARILSSMGKQKASQKIYSDLAKQAPDNSRLVLNFALQSLLFGHYAAGWDAYAQRLNVVTTTSRKPPSLPKWTGENLGAQYLLILAEQGIGDEVMFASCFADAMQFTPKLVIDCAPKLETLFRNSFPDQIIHGGEQKADYEWLDQYPIGAYIFSGDLPGIFRRSNQSFPVRLSYLSANKDRIDYWSQMLASLGDGLKVGISWVGGMQETRRRWRSLPLKDMKPILSNPDTHFISLQYTKCQPEINAFKKRFGITVHHWQDAIDDYHETAALVSSLDLVISVQTSVVHLAGALGKEAWVMVRNNPEWRYGESGTSMDWYTSLKLYRQEDNTSSWDNVVKHIEADLREYSNSTE